MRSLDGLFEPTRVAVVGATEREGSVGAAIMANLVEGFAGDVVPVNPNADTVFGLTAHDSVREVEGIDLAVITIPASLVIDVLEECAEADIHQVVVISAGFGESGSDGVERERQLVTLADRHEMNIVGPNSLGIMSTPSGLNASFGPDTPPAGHLSLFSQSGAFITAVVDWVIEHAIGFKDVVSLGNKAVLDETDFLTVWDNDPSTEVIAGYVESIDDGRRFIDVAREVTAETPVVLIKAGRTESAARAASSHTGALAGNDRAYDAAFRQSGVIRVDSVQELFDAAHSLAEQPLPESDAVAIVTNAGGPGVITTDAIGASTLSLAEFTAETDDRLRELLPEDASMYNPIDILGDADVDRFQKTLEVVLADEQVGAAMVLAAPTAVLDYGALASVIADIRDRRSFPITTCFMGGARVEIPRKQLTKQGIPCHFDPRRAIAGLDVLSRYREIQTMEWGEPTTFDVDRDRAQAVLERVQTQPENRLGIEAMDLLDAYGIPTPRGNIVDAPDVAEEIAREIDGPVAMKIVSPDILHKTDIGGVAVGVERGEVHDTYEQLIARARRYQPDARITGVQVQELIDIDAGVETIIGVNRDPQFGPVILFGLGGIFVEVLEDTTVRVAPLCESEAASMLDDIRAGELLYGARGREPTATEDIIETIQRISQLVMDFPAILELDINPLVALPDGVSAIDLRLTVDPQAL